jgi:hypothetical protein
MNKPFVYNKYPAGAISTSPKTEIVLGGLSLLLTVACYLFVLFQQGEQLVRQFEARELWGTTQVVVLSVIIFGFGYAILVYHVSRLAFYWHLRKRAEHTKAPPTAAESKAAAVAILIPSYCEEVHVIWQTIISAALVDYPDRHIVLLLDNPPNPGQADQWRLLTERV